MKRLTLPVLFISISIAAALLTGHDINAAKTAPSKVTLLRTPDGGIQPQAVTDERGTLHLIYLGGEPSSSDIFYVRRNPGEAGFTRAVRVNSQPGSAIATGTIRGAHLAVGKGGRAHVSWMGSNKAEPKAPNNQTPMLYARMNDARTAFEQQRNIIQFATGLDGGGSVAADGAGNVYVAWHGRGETEGEVNRRVWLARSGDEGGTFARESAAWSEPTGACGCCGMRAFADHAGNLFLLYRAATEMVNRDMFLLESKDHGRNFQGAKLHHWKINACPMSSATIAEGNRRILTAWETEGQVYYSETDPTTFKTSTAVAAPGETGKRKHPVVARNGRGETILVWTEGTGWKKGGRVAWQVFDQNGKPTAEKGEADGVPVWSLAAVAVNADGSFTIVF
ncbi:MAG TPA: hypothetical protein VFD58_02900 [Blastocatellia bacterium]|nr:hypothetical protein [Blastocatellia bacterium]